MEKRFKGKTGTEYELFKIACPHFEEIEKTIGKIIKKEYNNSKLKEIKILEIGCGPGYTTIYLLAADKRTKITAVDNERFMIKQIKKNLQEFIKNKRLKLIQKDALQFLKKQKENSFEIFASGFTLHNFTKSYRGKVLKEIYRILKPKGIFLNADKYALDNKQEHKKSLYWQIEKFKEEYSKINRKDLIKEWTGHYLEDNKRKRIMKEGKSISSMKKIGFDKIKTLFREQMDALLFAEKN